ncbi:MAG: hypothetical protein OHK0039_19530 [Bacteroidia bacterium]
MLIELQKTKQAFDVMRFRRYLGDNYRKEDEVSLTDGAAETRVLPIVTIYFLGFGLDNIHSGAVRIGRNYQDMITGDVLDVCEDFAELLTHDAYLIQVQRLSPQARTQLERLLQVFSPRYRTADRHRLDVRDDTDDPLLRRMIDRLGRAIASETIREKMDVEDELDRVFAREMRKLAIEKDETIAEKEGIIAEQEQQLASARRRAEEERRRAEEERQHNLDLLRQIEELKKQIKP